MILETRAADGCRLIGEATGSADAPALLFLNSVGCDRRLWQPQVAALAGEWRCLTFDARGHGASDAPDGDYTVAQLAQDALAILDAAGAAHAHVCGLSLGGLTAQQLALAAPERVQRLILANTASRIGSHESWEARIALVRTEGLEGLADAAMARFFSEGVRAAQPALVATWRQRLATSSATGYIGCCAALRDADLTAELGRITAATLVIGGAQDVSTPPEQTAALAAAILGARHVVLDAAHLSNLELPDAFTAALRGHLEVV